MRDDDVVDEPVREAVAAASSASVASLTDLSAGFHSALTHTPPAKRKWLLPASIAALVVLIAGSVIALSARQPAAPVTPVKAPVATPIATKQPTPTALVSAVPLPDSSIRVDSTAGAAVRRADSLRSKVRDTVQTAPLSDEARAEAARVRAAERAAAARRAARRDSIARADSIPKFRDATKPDTPVPPTR